METIVFLGSHKSGSSQDAFEAAERLGYFTVLLSNRAVFLQKRQDFPHIHETIETNIDDLDDIHRKLELLKSQSKRVIAIISFIDPYVHTAAKLGRELGLPHQTVSALAKMLDKVAMRDLLKDAGYCPFYATVMSPELDKHLPIIVKYPQSNGSKDVLLARSPSEIEKSVQYLSNRHPNGQLLFEEFIGGPQYLVEVLVDNGEPRIIAIVEQTITKEQRFIVTGYRIRPHVTPSLEHKVSKMVQTIVEKTGMVQGALHIEFKDTRTGCKVIEVNPRISGSSMNRMIQHAFGINLVEETLKSLLRMNPDTDRKYERDLFAQYVTIQEKGVLEKITGRHRARRVPGVVEVYAKPRMGTFLRPALSMGQRYAYVIAVGNSAEQAEVSAKTGAKMIRFHLAPKVKGYGR